MFIYTSNKAKMCLRDGCTLFEFFHELMHGRHAKEIGLRKYYKLGGHGTMGELNKEMRVFNKVIENKHLFTRQELKKSMNYINDVRDKFGEQKLIFEFDINKIPLIRKETNINELLKIK